MSPLKTLVLALAVTTGGLAAATDAPDPVVVQQLASSWEVLWHQSGAPTSVARWEKPIEVKVTGVQAGKYHDRILKQLDEITREAGLTWHEGDQPNLTIEVVPNSALEDNQPCVTYMEANDEIGEIEETTTQMRVKDVERCTTHELMHAMGLRGHPSGPTSLSYFDRHWDLQPLDRIFLHAWYSRAMKPAMSPLDAVVVLADQVVCGAQDRDKAIVARDALLTVINEDMALYAAGTGEPPQIIKRSGKETARGVKVGRLQMARYLSAHHAPFPAFDALQCQSAVIYRAALTTHQE